MRAHFVKFRPPAAAAARQLWYAAVDAALLQGGQRRSATAKAAFAARALLSLGRRTEAAPAEEDGSCEAVGMGLHAGAQICKNTRVGTKHLLVLSTRLQQHRACHLVLFLSLAVTRWPFLLAFLFFLTYDYPPSPFYRLLELWPVQTCLQPHRWLSRSRCSPWMCAEGAGDGSRWSRQQSKAAAVDGEEGSRSISSWLGVAGGGGSRGGGEASASGRPPLLPPQLSRVAVGGGRSSLRGSARYGGRATDGIADWEGSAPRAVPVSPMPNSPLWPASPLTGEGSQRSKGGQRAVRCKPYLHAADTVPFDQYRCWTVLVITSLGATIVQLEKPLSGH